MKNERRKTARLMLAYDEPHPAQEIIDNLYHEGVESALLVRGRMTDHDAWYELEIAGTRRAVENALLVSRSGLMTA